MFGKAWTTLVTKLVESWPSPSLSLSSISRGLSPTTEGQCVCVTGQPPLSHLMAAFLLGGCVPGTMVLNCHPMYPVFPAIYPEYSCLLSSPRPFCWLEILRNRPLTFFPCFQNVLPAPTANGQQHVFTLWLNTHDVPVP